MQNHYFAKKVSFTIKVAFTIKLICLNKIAYSFRRHTRLINKLSMARFQFRARPLQADWINGN